MRSMLFVPADSEKKLAKAMGSGADALILDLEDSVALANKAAARVTVAAFLKVASERSPRPRLWVRINPLDGTLWQDDLAAVMAFSPEGIMLPKARSGEDVHRLSIALHSIEGRTGAGAGGSTVKPGATRILPLVTEVPVSLLKLESYIGSSTRLEALTWGPEDLSAALGSTATREADGGLTAPYQLARNLCLIAAAAAGVGALDTVFVNFRDLAGLERECAAAARDGFIGKAAIHPDQVAVINAAFTPGAGEIEAARRVVAVFEAAGGAGVASLDGQMLDRPHLVRAERVLARARAAGLAA